MLGRGAGEGDEEEKWGAEQEPCLLQGKGLCCHGIFIPLWEMETCDTPIKSAMAWQDGQPDPAGRATTSSVSPGGGHSTAGSPATSQTSPPGSCSSAECGEGTINHRPPCPLTTRSPHSSSPSSATVPACAICQGEGTQECCQTPPSIPSQLKEVGCRVPKQSLLPALPGPPCPRQAAAGRVCRAVLEPQQLLPALFGALQTEPWHQAAMGPQVPRVSSPLAPHPSVPRSLMLLPGRHSTGG